MKLLKTGLIAPQTSWHGIPEVRNRVTINGAIEIGRAPGVIQVTFLAPLDKLDKAGLGDLAREQYNIE